MNNEQPHKIEIYSKTKTSSDRKLHIEIEDFSSTKLFFFKKHSILIHKAVMILFQISHS